MNVVIIGGGIGGLATAVALAKVGIEASVYERVAELREVGAGISLWANALRMLDILGLAHSLRAHGWSPIRTDIRTAAGAILVPGASDERAHADVMVGAMHRADLLTVLRSAVDDAHVHLSRECTAVRSDGRGVTAEFADGHCVTADLLVGADGLHSVARRAVHDGAPPAYAGYTAWRSVVPFDGPAPGGESWGCGQRFGIVPLNDGRVYWFATRNAPEHEREPAEAVKPMLMNLFRGWHAPIEALLDATPASAILRNDLYDREPLSSWVAGRVALLGDAAHPMTPNLGQGACQAIEDAVVLAACLARSDGIDAALRHYQARRLPRTRRLLLLSRRIGRIAQWESPFACSLRNAVIRSMPTSMTERQVRSIVDQPILTDDERRLFIRAH